MVPQHDPRDRGLRARLWLRGGRSGGRGAARAPHAVAGGQHPLADPGRQQAQRPRQGLQHTLRYVVGAGMLFLDDARIIACVGQAIWDDIIILDQLMLYTLVCPCVHGDNSGQLKHPAPATGIPLPLL